MDKKVSFTWQFVIAVIIFFTPLLGYIHILEPEGNLRAITIYGWEYIHGYEDDQFFLYDFFRLLTPAILYSIFYFTSKTPIKFFALFPLWLIFRSILVVVVPVPIMTELIVYLGIGIAIFLLGQYFFLERKIIKESFSSSQRKTKIESQKTFLPRQKLFFGLVLFSTPFFSQLWRITDIEAVELNIGLIMGDMGFPNVSSGFYYLVMKLVYFYPLIIWFIFQKSWWRYALLSPITVYLFQLYTIINPNSLHMDELELYQASFFLAAFAILLVFLTKAAYQQNYIASIYQNMRRHFEKKMEVRYEQKELQLRSKRKYLKQMVQKGKHVNLKDLQKLKGELEEQLAHL